MTQVNHVSSIFNWIIYMHIYITAYCHSEYSVVILSISTILLHFSDGMHSSHAAHSTGDTMCAAGESAHQLGSQAYTTVP